MSYEAPVGAAGTERLAAARILVVDDTEGNRAVVCRRLEQSGYCLHQVDSGEKALQFIRQNPVDLVLLDYMMPNFNGLDVLRVLRRDWKMDNLPVIMLTARAEANAQVQALEAGADDYVTKPIDFDVLQARIASHLNRSSNSNQLRQSNAAHDERAAMRVLTIDKLQDELEREIVRRQEVEGQLANLSGQKSGAIDAGKSPNDATKARALDIIDSISRNLASGQSINRALLSELRSLVELLRSDPEVSTSQEQSLRPV